MSQSFFLVPQSEDDSSIEQWDVTNDDIIAVLSAHGLKDTGSLCVEWVLSSEIPHFALRGVCEKNAKVLQGLCELDGIELCSGHFVTVDNAVYGCGCTGVKGNTLKKATGVIVNALQSKDLNALANACSHVVPLELRDSHLLGPSDVLALVYQLSLCLSLAGNNSSNVNTNGKYLDLIEAFTYPGYVKGFGKKFAKVFSDVVAPVLRKTIAGAKEDAQTQKILVNIACIEGMFSP